LDATTAEAKRPKYEQIADALRQRILGGNLRKGDTLPSVQELSRTFGVSPMTAHRGVQELVRERLVDCKARSQGMVVLRDTVSVPVQHTTLACLLRHHLSRNEQDNFGLEMISGMRQEISERGYRFIHHGLDELDYERRVAELVSSDAVSGLLIDEQTPLSVIRRLAVLPAPLMLLNRWEPAPNLSCVATDFERVGSETVRILKERGYERIRFFYRPLDESQWTEPKRAARHALLRTRQGFIKAMQDEAEANTDVLMIDEIRNPERYTDPAAYGLPMRKGADWRPTGLLALNDKWAVYLIEAIAKTDLVLGKDVGVVGCFDLEVGRHAPTPPSTWTIDRPFIGRMAAKTLIDRIEHPELGTGTIKLPMQFLDRQTA